MALVAYDFSDSEGNSEEEDEEEEGSANVVIPPANSDKKEEPNDVINSNITDDTIQDSDSDDVQPNASMFAHLPQSQTVNSSSIGENEIEDFVPKATKQDKPKPKVKITIPSLSDFKEDEDEAPLKRVKPSEKSSGLLSILPPAKGTPLSNKSFIPHSVSSLKNKPAAQKSESSKCLIPHAVRKKQANAVAVATAKAKSVKPKSSQGDESEDDEDIELPETFDDEMWEKVCGRPKPKPIIQDEVPEPILQYVDIAPEPVKPYSGLDNAAFKELIGRKRKNQNINIIDIHEDEILPEKDLWMTKSLTDPEMAPKQAIENPVDPTRRRKHHITYLAEQAKANEQELQNQWAASKFNRNASRAKYGF